MHASSRESPKHSIAFKCFVVWGGGSRAGGGGAPLLVQSCLMHGKGRLVGLMHRLIGPRQASGAG